LIHTLTLRRNLISLAIFNAIFEKLVVAYFFWATLYINDIYHDKYHDIFVGKYHDIYVIHDILVLAKSILASEKEKMF